MQFSFCLITKNEEKNLDKCLAPIANLNMEIIIVDTGSTDKTKEIASKYTDKIYDFKWINDFSAARNYALEQASNDFVFFLDSDEFSTDFDINHLLKTAGKYPDAIGQITRRNKCHSESGDCIYIDLVERFFDKRLFYYTGAIHEQVTSRNNTPLKAFEMKWTVYHEGYYLSEEKQKEKGLRNIELLLNDLKKNPQDPYTYYQLGQSYNLFNDNDNALKYYEHGFSLIKDTSLKYTELLVIGYGQSLISADRFDDAALLYEKFPMYHDNADFLVMIGKANLSRSNLLRAVSNYKAALKCTRYQTEGTNSFISNHNLGCIYEALGNTEKALLYYNAALPYEPSKEKLKTFQKKTDSKAMTLAIINYQPYNYLELLFNSLEEQTVSITSLEIILLNAAKDEKCYALMKQFEAKYEDNVILLPSVPDIDINIAVQTVYSYSGCDTVMFITDALIPTPDALRLFISASNLDKYNVIKSSCIQINIPASLSGINAISYLENNINKINDSQLNLRAYPVIMSEEIKLECEKKRLLSKPLCSTMYNSDFINSGICFSLEYFNNDTTYLEKNLYDKISSLFIIENICFILLSYE